MKYSRNRSYNYRKGFTLVEILIVVVILGILGVLVVPLFGGFSSDAKTATLRKELNTVRGAISLYKAQHGDKMPGAGDASFEQALTGFTDYDGNSVEAGSETFGPYLPRLPVNPFNGLDSVDTSGTAGDDSHGWYFDTETGQFSADDSGVCPEGVAHSEL